MTDARLIVVRRAHSSEKKALEGLQLRASLANEDHREQILANPDLIALPLEQIEGGGVFVAERDGVILGFAAVFGRNDGDCELDGLFVEPQAWRQGIGRRLVEEACRFARDCGASSLRVVGNPRATRFYEACGFQRTGETQTRFERAPTFVKRL